MTTLGVEATNSCSSGGQPAQRDAKKVEKSLRDDAQSRPRVDLDPFNACRANIPSIVQKFIMLIIFEEHVLCNAPPNRYENTSATCWPKGLPL